MFHGKSLLRKSPIFGLRLNPFILGESLRRKSFFLRNISNPLVVVKVSMQYYITLNVGM